MKDMSKKKLRTKTRQHHWSKKPRYETIFFQGRFYAWYRWEATQGVHLRRRTDDDDMYFLLCGDMAAVCGTNKNYTYNKRKVTCRICRKMLGLRPPKTIPIVTSTGKFER